MLVCKNDPKRKYKGDEPSPKGFGWCAHGEKEGKARKGRDGNRWVVKKVSNGSLRWVKSTGDSKSIKVSIKKNHVKNNIKTTIVKSDLYDYKNFGIYNHKKKETLVGIYNHKEKLLYPWVKYNKFSNGPITIPTGYRRKYNKKCTGLFFGPDKKILDNKYKGYKKTFIYSEGSVYTDIYMIYVSKQSIYIYTRDNICKDIYPNLYKDFSLINEIDWTMAYTKLVKTITNYKSVYYGKDGKDINSVLISLTDTKHILLTRQLVTFETRDKILKYYSNYSGLYPNPVVVGEKYIYFPDTQNTCYHKSDFKDFPKKYSWAEDAESKADGMNDFNNDRPLSGIKYKRSSER